MYIAYRQLFGYGWWSTLWRLVAVILSQLAIVTAVFVIVIVCSYDEQDIAYTYEAFLIIIGVLILLTAVILCVTHRINKRTYRNNNKEIISNL
jgi:peptidoglycan/LPS O-acetylase OafA/YrhL